MDTIVARIRSSLTDSSTPSAAEVPTATSAAASSVTAAKVGDAISPMHYVAIRFVALQSACIAVQRLTLKQELRRFRRRHACCSILVEEGSRRLLVAGALQLCCSSQLWVAMLQATSFAQGTCLRISVFIISKT